MGTHYIMAPASLTQKVSIGLISLALLAACVACFLVAFTTKPPDQKYSYETYTVNLTVPGLGTLEGRHRAGAVQFYGVPYAKQPERFEHAGFPPEEFEYRAAYVPETSAPICWGGTYGSVYDWVPGNNGENSDPLTKQLHDEKCLYMQISVPERLILDPENYPEKLPVFMYSHGGNFHSGSSTMPLYEGRYLASMGDIIVISINYRMDVFGFLPIANTWGSNDQESVGNFGLTDQQVAMKFVNTFIEHFGGDKNRLTIAGQSAGSESAYLNMLAGRANGNSEHQDYYHRVMLMSIPSLPYLNSDQGYENVMQSIWRYAHERYPEICTRDYSGSDTENPFSGNCTALLDKSACDWRTASYRDEANQCLYKLTSEQMWDLKGASKYFMDFGFIQDRAFQVFSLAQSYDPIIDGNIV